MRIPGALPKRCVQYHQAPPREPAAQLLEGLAVAFREAAAVGVDDAGERVVRVMTAPVLPHDCLSVRRRRVDPRVDGVAVAGSDREGVGRDVVRERFVALLRVRALSLRGHGGDDYDDPAHAVLVQLRVRQPRDGLFAAVLDEGKGAGQAYDHCCCEECWC